MARLPGLLVDKLAAATVLANPRLRFILETTVALALSVAFALRFGFNYGTDNQTSYLLGALHKFDPELLRYDWLTAETTPYHPAFQFLGWGLYAINSSGWAFGIANFISIACGGMLLFWICRLVIPKRYVLLTYLLWMTVLMITETDSIAITYFFEYIFQPSNLGTLGWLTAIAFWLSGRWLAAGIALAAGGMMHANFLLMTFPVFGLAHLLMGRRDLLRRLVRTLAPSAVVLLLFLPILSASLGSADSEAARIILFEIRSPHHYLPVRFQGDFLPFAIWQALGLALGAPFLRQRSRPGGRLAVLLFSLIGLVWTATALTTAVSIPQVAQLFVWRLAPFCDVLVQLMACAGIVRLLLRPIGLRQYPMSLRTIAVSGLGFLIAYYSFIRQPALPKLALWCLLALATTQLLRLMGPWVMRLHRLSWTRAAVQRLAPAVLIVLAAFVWVEFSWQPVRNFKQRSNLIQGLNKQEVELYTWVQSNTSKDAVFLTPPGLERFRLHAKRGIIVDWKSPPLSPTELVEWYRRLCRVSGNPEVSSLNAANAGYRRLDASRLQSLVAEYGVQYAVINGVVPVSLRGYNRLFTNGKYTVLAIRSGNG